MQRISRLGAWAASLLLSFGMSGPQALGVTPNICFTRDFGTATQADIATEVQGMLDDPTCDVIQFNLLTYNGTSFTLPADTPWVVDGTALSGGRDVTIYMSPNDMLTIYATNSLTALKVQGPNDIVRLENLTIAEASTSAITVREPTAQLHLENVVLSDNATDSNGGAVNTTGVLYLHGTNRFANNRAIGGFGGAIYAAAGVSGAGSTGIFTFNSKPGQSARSGGAIYAPNTQTGIVFQDLTIEDSTASSDGGAIYGGNLTVTGHGSFSRVASTGGDGGAAGLFGSASFGSLSVTDSSANGDGGAFDVVGNFTVAGAAVVENSLIDVGSGGRGGFLAVNGQTSLGSLDISYGFSDSEGGGIYSTASGTGALVISGELKVFDVHADGNGGVISSYGDVELGPVTSTKTSARYNGGLLYNPTNGVVELNGDVSISDSSSAAAGGAFALGGKLVAKADFASSNTRAGTQGGSIYATDGVAIQGETRIDDSRAVSAGGAIAAVTRVSLANGYITNSHATSEYSQGGCVFSQVERVDVEGPFVFDGCSAGYGGAVFSDLSQIIRDTTFRSNIARHSGGAVRSVAGRVATYGATSFTGNTVDGNGGAIDAPDVLIGSGTRFIDNVAESLGGAIIANNVNVTLASFEGNEARGGDGAAIYGALSSGRVDVSFSSFYRNVASGVAGAIYSEAPVFVDNSYFAENSATGAATTVAAAVFGKGDVENLFNTFHNNATEGISEIAASHYNSIGTVIDSPSARPIATGTWGYSAGNVYSGPTSVATSDDRTGVGSSAIGLIDPYPFTVGSVIRYASGIGPTSAAREIVTKAMFEAAVNDPFVSGDFSVLSNFYAGSFTTLNDFKLETRSGDFLDSGAFEYQLLPQLVISSATLASDGRTLTLATNTPVASGSHTGFSLVAAGKAVSLSAASEAGDQSVFLILDEPVTPGSTLSLSYTGNSVVSLTEPFNILAPFADLAVTNNSQFIPPPPYAGPILMVPSGTFSPGDLVTLSGGRLQSVTSVSLGGVPTVFSLDGSNQLSFTVPELSSGEYQLEIGSSFGLLRIQNPIRVANPPAIDTSNSVSAVIKKISPFAAKVWAMNVVANGKVQIFVNGREVAWIRAIDELDPKLRLNGNSHYLVRTIKLSGVKTKIEVFVNGKQIQQWSG